MAVFRRRIGTTGKKETLWSTKFMFAGKQYFRNTGTTNKTKAREFEVELRKQLAKDAFENRPGNEKQEPIPLLKDFIRLPEEGGRGGAWWDKHAIARYETGPMSTLRYYRDRVKALLAFPGFADSRLDQIGEEILDTYDALRTEAGISGATINRDFGALLLILRRAHRWKLIKELPEIQHKEEAEVGIVITPGEEAIYMSESDRDHQDFSSILIETAMMPISAATMQWPDVHIGQVRDWENGYMFDRCEKTNLRARELGMTPRLAARMRERKLAQGGRSLYVFPADRLGLDHPTPLSTFQTTHQRFWQDQHGPALTIRKFRIYDFRHTALTRAHEAGADIFDLMQMAGWASPAMAKRYIKNNTAMKNKNVERLHDYNERQRQKLGIIQAV